MFRRPKSTKHFIEVYYDGRLIERSSTGEISRDLDKTVVTIPALLKKTHENTQPK
jgi:hypothetical protein